jgi:hypothetical protein
MTINSFLLPLAVIAMMVVANALGGSRFGPKHLRYHPPLITMVT